MISLVIQREVLNVCTIRTVKFYNYSDYLGLGKLLKSLRDNFRDCKFHTN